MTSTLSTSDTTLTVPILHQHLRDPHVWSQPLCVRVAGASVHYVFEPASRPDHLFDALRRPHAASLAILFEDGTSTTVLMQVIGRLFAHYPTLILVVLADITTPIWKRFERELSRRDQLVFLDPSTDPASVRRLVPALHPRPISHRPRLPHAPSPPPTPDHRLLSPAASLAHELNTPIQFVNDSIFFLEEACHALAQLGRATLDNRASSPGVQTLLDHHFDDPSDLAYLLDESPRALNRVRDGIERIITLVGAMRAFAPRARAQQTRPANINDAVENALLVSRHVYRDRADITLNLDDLPPVDCHIEDINQVLLNLIVNAAHSIHDDRRGHITVETEHDGASVVIRVIDDGRGISPHDAGRVFDRFFSTKPSGEGTGQGLAIAKQIVEERHGGRIWFDSSLDAGTTFSVRLPISPSAPLHTVIAPS